MKRISNTLFLPLFSLVSATSSYAAISSSSASLVDTSQNQTFESEPPALGSVFPDLEPAHSFKLAAVHFITNDNALNFGNQEFLPADLCKQGGYTHEGCPSGYIKGEPCPYDSKFVKDCIDPDTWCKNNGYAITSCSVPKYPANPCPYKSSLYKSCETDNIRACKELGYSLTCETGKIGDSAQACPYNSSYKKCICNPCSGYDYTAAQASAQGYVPGEVCNSCGSMKYKRSENACSGYKTCDCGSESGAKVCYSGSAQKFDTCKSCCDSNIYKYDSTNCNGEYTYCPNDMCGGKAAVCVKKIYNYPQPFTYAGLKYVSDFKQCDNYINGGFYDEQHKNGIARDYDNLYYRCRSDAEIECIKLSQEISDKKEVYLKQDYNCGFERLAIGKIHGNGHTITFDRPFGVPFYTSSSEKLELENMTLINKATHYQIQGKGNICCQFILTCSETEKQMHGVFGNLEVNLTNVNIVSDIPLGFQSRISFYGNNTVEEKGWVGQQMEQFYVYGRLFLKRPEDTGINTTDSVIVRTYSGSDFTYEGYLGYPVYKKD